MDIVSETEKWNFNTLVDQAYIILDQQTRGEDLILPEIIVEISTTRLHWKNIKEYLKVIKRRPEHFVEWLKYEIPGYNINWMSSSKSDGIIIHGKKQKKSDIMELAIKYVKTFVICSSCKHADTLMTKLTNKQYEFICNDCGMKKFF